MASRSALQDTEKTVRFFPVSIGSLDPHTLAMDLYFKPSGHSQPVLYRSTGVDFTVKDQQRLIAQGVEFLYIPTHQHAVYRRVLSQRLDRLYRDPETNRAERVRAVRASCAKMIEDVLVFPGQTEAIDAVTDISKQFAAWSSENNEQFAYLLDMSAHDYYTTTHMVNVGVGCGLLVRELRPNDAGLQAVIVQGGLLHDIGKRGVPTKLLNKEGQLEPEEWEIIKRHPQTGYKELKGHPGVPDVVLEMTRDHHERPDGKGYPAELKDSQIGFAARLCTVADVFDAICAARPYRGATPPLDTLEIMRDGAGRQFDREIFDAWARIVERLIEKDPERAMPSTHASAEFALDDFGQAAPDHATPRDALDPRTLWSDERRRHPRFNCDLTIKAMFLRQGKSCPVKAGQWVIFHAVDISQGGVQLRTPWPLSLNDVLHVELPLGQERRAIRKARVVRVRRGEDQEWFAGLCFISDSPKP
jgi:HD-GYP domain-containing protein (c-di-GMP phosphodiesterase class II)